MKKMQVLSGLMAMAISAMSMGIVANAADVTLKVGSDEQEPGAKYSVDVDLAGVPSSGLTSIDFAISYDPSIISVKDVTLGSIGNTGAVSQEGELGDTVFDWVDTGKQIVIIWSTGLTDSKYFVAKDGTFLTISGTVKDNAEKGATCKLTPVAVDREAYPGGSANPDIVLSCVTENGTTDYTAAASAGAVKVKGGNSSTTEEANYGDVNCDGAVDVKDAVLLARMAASDKTAEVSEQGKINANVVLDDNKGDDKDLGRLLKYLAGKIEKSVLGTK